MSLVIRQEQMDAFRIDRLGQFVADTVCHLRTRFPVEASAYDDVALDALVREAIKCGIGFGVTSGFDLKRFAECVLLYGTGFPKGSNTPWAAEILGRKNISGRQKMTAISRYETFAARPSR